MTKLGVFAVAGVLLVPCTAHAQNIIKVSPDRNTVTVTNQKGTATSTIVRDGNGGGTITTRYQKKESYQPMGSGGYQPMGSGR
jgi:hypothetical protein